jgi:hypothetical protein
MAAHLTSIDLFSGCGGFTLGLVQAGSSGREFQRLHNLRIEPRQASGLNKLEKRSHPPTPRHDRRQPRTSRQSPQLGIGERTLYRKLKEYGLR